MPSRSPIAIDILAALPIPTIVIDKNGRVVLQSETFNKMLSVDEPVKTVAAIPDKTLAEALNAITAEQNRRSGCSYTGHPQKVALVWERITWSRNVYYIVSVIYPLALSTGQPAGEADSSASAKAGAGVNAQLSLDATPTPAAATASAGGGAGFNPGGTGTVSGSATQAVPGAGGIQLPGPDQTCQLLQKAMEAGAASGTSIAVARLQVIDDGTRQPLYKTDIELWRQVARRLRALCRVSDLVGMTECGDYIIILLGADLHTAQTVTHRVLGQIEIWLRQNVGTPLQLAAGYAVWSPKERHVTPSTLLALTQERILHLT
ncbi:MAG TPA: hypothetical protein GXX29_12385 [Firmicutes bacterium]|nr:hypothetical protein [Bacillota bacterium]